MSLVRLALRRPYTVFVLVVGIVAGAVLALSRMPADVFPPLGVPTIYVAQPYPGMTAAQMEGFLTYYYEYNFLYIDGIQSVQARSIQGVALIKLTFQPGTDMSQAMAQTVQYVNRAHAYMPPGAVPPFVVRYDAGSVPLGYLAFSSPSRTVAQIEDLALNTVRPLFATLPGVSAAAPFGGSARTVVVSLDPTRLHAYRITPQEVVEAIANTETVSPSGNIDLGSRYPVVTTNSIVRDVSALAAVPIRAGTFPAVFVRDVGRVTDGSDITTSEALVDGKPTIYVPVTKSADASTLAVVNEVRANLSRFQAVLPPDVQVRYVMDQSPFVTRAIGSLTLEGALGALLAGAMVLLFLRDWRSAFIVVLNIPISLLAAVLALWLTGQSINLMTLGGLVLAVGILVDQSTVVIENIHTHLVHKETVERAVLDASHEVVVPLLIAMLCVVAVFLPSFQMEGAARALFVPLSLAVGFSMIASYLLANSLVPVLSVWAFRRWHHAGEASDTESRPFLRLQAAFRGGLGRLRAYRWALVVGYLAACALGLVLLLPRIGTDIFPRTESGRAELEMRLRLPAGTRLDLTVAALQRALSVIRQQAGPDSVSISLGLAGTHGSPFPENFIYLWNSGPQEGVLTVQFRQAAHLDLSAFRDRLRSAIAKEMPQVEVSFQPADIVSRVMSFGAETPIEVDVVGPDLQADQSYAVRVRAALGATPRLRDVQLGQQIAYPSIDVDVDRERAGLLGVTQNDVIQSLTPSTASSRYTKRVFWASPNGIAYGVQVQVPQHAFNSIEDVRDVQVLAKGGDPTLLRNLGTIERGTVVGEYDDYDNQHFVSVTANLERTSLGEASTAVARALGSIGPPPRGMTVAVHGEAQTMATLLGAMRGGLLLAVFVIGLLLVANFQSWELALVTIASVPAVIVGVALMLWLTGTTLNLESFIGAIMAVGVAIANAILFVTFAERARLAGEGALEAGITGAVSRLRPIVMTSLAMLAGMLPMAAGWGEGGQQTAPLGRAVIGGMSLATLATLWVLPSVFSLIRARAPRRSPSLDPDDPSQVQET
ncbi:MAG TPA: efflux RND transporter permease subunit [Steroidobacteraceae bacterium]|nr:efflux RND transporter permease subunit [Steroidobacteraceae bacterium]